jgi:hypothetical protein
MISLRTLKGLTIAVATSAALGAYADAGGLPQASLNLEGSSMTYCNTVKNEWTITKEADANSVVSGTAVTWTINATKNNGGPAPAPTFCVQGSLVITNSGAAPATVGNIVVNLQKQKNIGGKQRWVSASVDIADKTNRDLATQAYVVAAASAEDPAWNATNNSPATYTASGGIGLFKENSASGSIVFSDATWGNDVLTGYLIAPGATVTLDYQAFFDSSALGSATSARTEVLVTFGNAGGRGGSGASVSGGTDIDGSGTLTNDEGNVRTVPVRASMLVPAVEQCNDSVTLTDVMTGDGVSYQVTGGDLTLDETGTGTDTASTTTSWSLVTILTGEGTVTNVASIAGPADTGCCEQITDSAEATVTVTPEPPCVNCGQCPCGESESIPGRCNPCTGGSFCTYTIGQYKLTGKGTPSNGTGSTMFTNYFQSAFSSGMSVGNYTPTTPSSAPYGYLWQGNAVGQQALRQFNTGGTGSTSAFTADMQNPSSGAGGTGAVQLNALTLNVGFSAAGVMPTGTAGANLGSVLVCPVDGSPCPVSPLTVNQIIGIANTLFSGGTNSDFDLNSISALLNNLNRGFDACVVNDWARTHTASPQ